MPFFCLDWKNPFTKLHQHGVFRGFFAHIWWSNCCFSYSLKRHSKLPDTFFTVQCTTYIRIPYFNLIDPNLSIQNLLAANISNLNLTTFLFWETQPCGSVPKTLNPSLTKLTAWEPQSLGPQDRQRSRFMTGAQRTALWTSEAQVSKFFRDTGSPIPANGKLNRLIKLPMMRNI